MKNYIFLFWFCIFNFASGTIKHKPIASPLNHSVSTGMAFEPYFTDREKLFGSNQGVFLNYTYYFSSWDNLLPKNYRGYLNWGLEGGTKLFRNTPVLCKQKAVPLLIWGGAQARIRYWETFQPFMGFGFNHVFCHKNLKTIHSSSVKLDPSFSFGFSLSLKFLEPSAIYSLDEDYGLNDLTLFTRCFQLKKSSELKGRFVCQVGLEALF